jgi:muramoyltetrapeptide carboxypeptidase
MTPRTRAGLVKVRPLRAGGRVALVAPASAFDRAAFEAGLAELRRLGLDPVYDDTVFERGVFSAGPDTVRAEALRRAWARPDVDAILAVRGGYGSVEVLPRLEIDPIRRARTAFIGYSDLTSVHTFLTCQVGITSVQGAMVEGRLAVGTGAYDPDSFLRVLGPDPLGELAPDGLEILRGGDAVGPLFGGTLTQLLASLGTPFEFRPPAGHVLFLEEIGERPYRLHRMLTQLRLADVVRERLADFPGPVLFGFPSGHTTTPLVSLPLGVDTRVVAVGRPRVVIEESAAAD